MPCLVSQMIHFTPPPKHRLQSELVQLLGNWDGKTFTGPMALEEKRDGWRAAWFRGLDGEPRLWTRGGHEIQGVQHIHRAIKAIEEIAGQPLFIDAEFQVDGTLLATKTWAESGWKSGGNNGTLFAFDILTDEEWRSGISNRPWHERKAWMYDLIRQYQEQEAGRWEWPEGSRGNIGPVPIRAIQHRMVKSAAEAHRLCCEIWQRGGEGIVLKDPNTPYWRNRNQFWQRWTKPLALKKGI